MTDTHAHIAIAAGGTAGHVNPALALAEELRDRGHSCTFFGNPNKLESRLVPEAGFDFVPLSVSGLDRSRPWTALSAAVRVIRATSAIKDYYTDKRPDVAIGFGAYVEVPLLRWCAQVGIPTIIHEQNSVPGLANKLMAKSCTKVCLAFPEAISAFSGSDTVLTGNPVRKSVIEATRDAGRASFNIPSDAQLLLIFGGSLGAQHLNQAVVSLKDELLSIENLYIIHSTGAKTFEETAQLLGLSDDEKSRWQLFDYIHNMGEALAASDLVISRAGASSVAEIAATKTPAVLVPYPYATADHQRTNANLLVEAGAAVLVDDDKLDERSCFADVVFELIKNPEHLTDMREKAAALKQDEAVTRLADIIEQALS